VHDDEYMSKKNYYGQAHDIREIVTEQATILVNGKLKEYQVKYNYHLSSWKMNVILFYILLHMIAV